MKNCRGFTLIEVLVSTAIISVITGATLIYFHSGNKNWALIRSAQKVSQDIRRASNMALSSPKINCSEAFYQPKGYGVYFSSAPPGTSYILFGDMDGNNSYDGPSSGCYSQGRDVIVETINLENNVKILSLVPTGSFSVVFVPPDPKVNFSSGTFGTINLSLISDTSKTKKITVNIKGNINIE